MDKKGALALSLGMLLLAGCKGGSVQQGATGGSNTLVGTWKGTEPNPMKNMKMMGGSTNTQTANIALTYKFNQDGSFSITSDSGPISSELDGNYTYAETTKLLNTKLVSMKIGSKGSKAPISGNTSKSETITWKTPNEFVVSAGPADVDLKRQ
ncbi:MAG TPA: hypothetical protein VGL56_16250 [Fimbriimonadaceae bacterium]|jgi:hypothetical protein